MSRRKIDSGYSHKSLTLLSAESSEDDDSRTGNVISLDASDENIVNDSSTDISFTSPSSLYQSQSNQSIVEESLIESSLRSERSNSTSHDLSITNTSDIEFVGSYIRDDSPEVTVIDSSSSNETGSDVLCTSDVRSSVGTQGNDSSEETEDSDVIIEGTGGPFPGVVKDEPELDRSMLEREIRDKKVAYHNVLKAVLCCDLKKLKDGGKLLKDNLARCRQELDELEKKLANLPEAETDVSAKFSVGDESEPSRPGYKCVNQVDSESDKCGITPQWLGLDAVVTIHESLTTRPNAQSFEDDPIGLTVDLMPHQKHALAWLLWREKQTPSGGILADDMGLGKTLSMIALILRSKELGNVDKGSLLSRGSEEEDEDDSSECISGDVCKGKTLVVCEASLIGQWEGQIKKYCESDYITIHVHHGKTRLTEAASLAAYDVIITTYGLIIEENKRRKDGRKGSLYRVKWERLILDEAHVIRNYKTQKAIAACELLGRYRWCLTGTPIQNKELDLYSLLKFIRCSPFDDRSVWKRWVDNKSANGLKRIKTLMSALLLRRTKEELKCQGKLNDLPSKKVVPVYVELDEDESKVYEEVLKFSKSFLIEYLHQKESPAFSRGNYLRLGNDKSKDIKTTEIFVLLLRLRQICCLPGLIHSLLEEDALVEDGALSDSSGLEDLNSQLSRMSISHPKTLKEANECKKLLLKSNPLFDINRASSKINSLLNITKELLASTDDKIVVVSQWTNLLRLLSPHLQRLGVGVVIFDGTVPIKFRSKIIDDFNDPKSGVRIMLLSLKAGGVGLNLFGGNRLVIFEPHWNPQLESQACDRVYRIGQRKEVFIYKIICKGTVEERIAALQRQKLETADNILQDIDSKSKLKHLTLRDLISLFDV